MNSGITLIDVRAEAMEAISKLKNGTMDVKVAGEIRNLLNSVIDTAKVQVEYLKAIPISVKEKMTVNEVKAIAGTLIDRDAELDVSLTDIRESMNKPYQIDK